MERWRPIPGWPGYEVSDMGGVRSWLKRGRAVHTGRRAGPYLLALFPDRKGYLRVNLRSPSVRSKDRYVHQLVLEAFIGPCPAGQEARHVNDRTPANNRLSNLAWGTKSQNQADRRLHGTDNRGARNAMAKLTDRQREYIRSSRAGGDELAARFGVSPALISMVRGPMSAAWRSKQLRLAWERRRMST